MRQVNTLSKVLPFDNAFHPAGIIRVTGLRPEGRNIRLKRGDDAAASQLYQYGAEPFSEDGKAGESLSFGAMGSRKEGKFYCEACGYQAEIRQNTARNVIKRGESEEVMGTAVRMNEGDEP